MNADFQESFKKVINKIKETGDEYAEKKSASWYQQELKGSMLALQMNKTSVQLSDKKRESVARASEEYLQYLRETREAIRQEHLAKSNYEKAKASFEGLRSLSSLEKRTMSLVDGE